MTETEFRYTGERFADIQLLRYRLNGFEQLSLSQKRFIFCLAKATLYGRVWRFSPWRTGQQSWARQPEPMHGRPTILRKICGTFWKSIGKLKTKEPE